MATHLNSARYASIGKIIRTKYMRKFLLGLLLITAVCGPLLSIYGIWLPVIKAFHIEHFDISDDIVARSRAYPKTHIMQELEQLEVSGPLPRSILDNIEEIAQDLRLGNVNLGNFPKTKINMPFDDLAVFSGNSHWQLSYASFFIPKLFLQAYVKSGNSEYLMAARDFILGWDKFEQEIWRPESFVWNDHAVAARSIILGKFWYHYKSHTDFDRETGRSILNMAAREAAFLARDLNYTFKTNHGTMQNLAILKMALFFPKVTDIQNLKQIAVRKLIGQFDFFINDEGVILEHSAGYHSFGMNLLSTAFALFNTLDITIPPDLNKKYNLGLTFLKALRRTDGTLPKLGDTSGNIDILGQNTLARALGSHEKSAFRPENDATFKPMAGYAVWWSNLNSWPNTEKLSQTAITWSYFPFMGHKHADELSLNIWKGGQEWWTSVGYWPYTDDRREKAISWTGANAPHLTGEDMHSDRKSSILSYASHKNIKVIDLLRQRPDGFKVRRQIVMVGDSIWITLDAFNDPKARQGQVIWTLHPTLRAQPKNTPQDFHVTGKETTLGMDIFFRGGDGMKIRKVRGLENPIIGWTASEQDVFPADAFVINQKSDGGWIGAISVIDTKTGDKSANIKWSGAEEWFIKIIRDNYKITVKRSGNIISVNNPAVNKITQTIKLDDIPKDVQSQKKIATSYYKSERMYGKRFLPLITYRVKISKALVALFFINLAFLFFQRRKFLYAATTSIVTMAGLYYWLINHYFIASI